MENYIVIYQVKSGFCNVDDKLTLSKPATDFYDILHVTLPKGYEYGLNIFDMPGIWAPNGLLCHLSRTGKHGKDGDVCAYTYGLKAEDHTMEVLPFAE